MEGDSLEALPVGAGRILPGAWLSWLRFMLCPFTPFPFPLVGMSWALRSLPTQASLGFCEKQQRSCKAHSRPSWIPSPHCAGLAPQWLWHWALSTSIPSWLMLVPPVATLQCGTMQQQELLHFSLWVMTFRRGNVALSQHGRVWGYQGICCAVCSELGAAPAEVTEPHQPFWTHTSTRRFFLLLQPSPAVPKSSPADAPFTPDSAAFGWRLIRNCTQEENSRGRSRRKEKSMGTKFNIEVEDTFFSY